MATETTTSKDGTTIAFERVGTGPAVILVDGALCYRGVGPSRSVAERLAERFTVITYDRRGRGESGDTPPHSEAREIEDLEALIEEAGGKASLCGFSSGAVLALDAAAAGLPVETLALYEPPFIVDDSRPPIVADYVEQLNRMLAEDRRGDMVKLFMRQVGMPGILVAISPLMPAWRKLKGIAHTLRYDAACMGDTQKGKPLPTGRWASATAPAIIFLGGKSPEWMQHGLRELDRLLPNSELRTLEGQTHMVKAKAVAPALEETLRPRTLRRSTDERR
jgi:pimeloyl-ACP methyl ester carboxylesterase